MGKPTEMILGTSSLNRDGIATVTIIAKCSMRMQADSGKMLNFCLYVLETITNNFKIGVREGGGYECRAPFFLHYPEFST